MRGLFTKIKKLQLAINTKASRRITLNTTQWYSDRVGRPINKYHVKRQVEPQSRNYEELFSSYSNLQIVLFLRDYWYLLNEEPLPVDNEMWNEIREKNKDVYDNIRDCKKQETTEKA